MNRLHANRAVPQLLERRLLDTSGAGLAAREAESLAAILAEIAERGARVVEEPESDARRRHGGCVVFFGHKGLLLGEVLGKNHGRCRPIDWGGWFVCVGVEIKKNLIQDRIVSQNACNLLSRLTLTCPVQIAIPKAHRRKTRLSHRSSKFRSKIGVPRLTPLT